MTHLIEQLITALREELQQYGEMLALLERQHEYIMARSAEDVYHSVKPIQEQGRVIVNAREKREQCRRNVAAEFKLEHDAGFAALISLFPKDYQPLLRALVEENNDLLARVRHKARQNHLLLSRSLELMQGLINTLLPSHETKVYNDQGNMRTHAIVTRSFYEAVG